MHEWFGKFVRGRAFAAIFCVLGVLMAAYLTLRLGMLLEAFTAVDLRLWIFAVLAVFSGYMLVYTNSGKAQKRTWKLFNFCGTVLCYLLSMVICFLLFDGVRLLLGLRDSRLYLIPLLLALALTVYGFVHARKLRIRTYRVPLAGAEEGGTVKTLVLLSDIHVGSYVDSEQLHKIVSAANQAGADMVVLAGDTFDQDAFDRCDLTEVKRELQTLQPRGAVYAVLGNHDPNSGRQEIRRFFQEAGIHLLVDACAETADFQVVGRDDILGNPHRKPLEELLGEGASEKPVIVVDHNPLGINDGVRLGADLVLCGHTHKGQFFPATVFTKLAYGPRGFYGHYQTGRTHSVVSAGAGYFQLPVRLGTDSEIVALQVVLPAAAEGSAKGQHTKAQ